MEYKRHETYKDSGIDWIGEIPDDWDIKKLKYLGTYYSGGTPSKDNMDFWNGDIPWVSPKDMKVNIVSNAEEHITIAGLSNSSSRLLDIGTILIVVRSGILKHTIPVAINSTPIAINQDIKAIKCIENLSPRFLFYVIRGFQNQLLKIWCKAGATVESIEHQYLVNTSICYPNIKEQDTICDYLDQKTSELDDLINDKEKIIELLQEQRQAIIIETVTKGLNHNTKMKDSGIEWIGEIPEHWKIYRLIHVAELKTGHTPRKTTEEYWENCTIPWVTLNDVGFLKNNDYIDEPKNMINELGLANSSAVLLPERTVILSRDATIGQSAIITKPMATSQHFVNWICGDTLIPEYLLYFFKGPMQLEFDSYTMGSTLKTIGMSNVRQFKISIPPLKEQEEIINYVRENTARIDELISRIKLSIDQFRVYRQSLISEAVTGKIDVRDYPDN